MSFRLDADISAGIGAPIIGGTAGSVLFVGASGNLAQDNANLFWDDTNNRLGIGTTAPANTLSLYRTGSTPILQLYSDRSGWSGSPSQLMQNRILFGGVNNQGWSTPDGAGIDFSTNYPTEGSTGKLNFWAYPSTTASPNMTLMGNGNVGIGTTTPTAKLTITKDTSYGYSPDQLWLNSASTPTRGLGLGYGSLAGQDFGFIQAIDVGNAAKNLVLNAVGGNVGIGTTDPGAKLQIGSPNNIGDTVGNTPVVRVIGDAVSTTTQTVLRLRRPTVMTVQYGDTVDFNMLSYGTGGVGDNYAPKTQLNIALKNSSVYSETADVNVMTLQSSGNVGIGTTVPEDKLTVTNSSAGVRTTALRLENNSSTVGTASSLDFDVASSIAVTGRISNILETDSSRSLAFEAFNIGSTALEEKMRILGNGNVGIGTTSPTAVLHLKAGTATASTAPLKFTSGTSLTAAEAGAMEWDGTNLFISQTAGPTRKTLAYTDSAITSSTYVGTTAIALNRASATQVLTGVGINGSSVSVTDSISNDIDTYTKLLIHFDGANGATAYTAETAQVLTFAGNAQLSTAAAKFGASSLLLDGTTDYVTVPDSDDWDFGNGNFTIDFNMNFNTVSDASLYFQSTDATNYVWIRLLDDHRIRFYVRNTAGTVCLVDCTFPTFVTGQWYHVSIVRNSTNILMFVNGVAASSYSITTDAGSTTFDNFTGVLNIGHGGTAGDFNGYIDEFRVSKGICRNSAAFTSPISAYNSIKTNLLTASNAIITTVRSIGGTAPVADGTYTVGCKITPVTGSDGTITVKSGIITAIQQAT